MASQEELLETTRMIDACAKELAEKGHNNEAKLRGRLWEVAGMNPDHLDEPAIYRHIEKLVNEITQQEMEDNPQLPSGDHTIDGVHISNCGVEGMTEKEARNYITCVRTKCCSREARLMTLSLRKAPDGESVALDYAVRQKPMERIRRITGYLVGTVDRWNNAKQAELHDRVKHTQFSR